MDEKNDFDKVDEVMLPGFRFHPTDEELVGFYLKRKLHQRSLPIELIKQLDIYKFDPWDLPKLATTGEKEWYFYCPRDRKYRNSSRPNRVTGAGFWKATGTDRPIYSSEGSKCIGLKKSLVFYKGRAAKGIKTDWMMHEFRLPSLVDAASHKRPTLVPQDSWAICRIFKKTNSMAQRALSHSWVSPLPETLGHVQIIEPQHPNQFHYNNDLQHSSTAPSYSPLDVLPYKPIGGDLPNGCMFSSPDIAGPTKCTLDFASLLANFSPAFLGEIGKVPESLDFSGVQQQSNNSFSITALEEIEGNAGVVRSVGFPFNLPTDLPNAWKVNIPWDSLPSPSEMSASYSTNTTYT
ncbi:hypothetical protein GIB67_012011 [Kingdonia uniflora]|uniref:NAC domain-containing protein n=1 Tax=Kingdonia uniflora TaxID=39325 RepID=A0A7J7M011_9MAGN|nr:hypothetical protein GIB67_012011 [Kingdonia uniflora]